MGSNLVEATTDISIDLPIEEEYFCDHCGEAFDDLHKAWAVGFSVWDPHRARVGVRYLHKGECRSLYRPRKCRDWEKVYHDSKDLDEFLAHLTDDRKRALDGVRRKSGTPLNPRIKFKPSSKPKVKTRLRGNKLIIEVTIELPGSVVNADVLTN